MVFPISFAIFLLGATCVMASSMSSPGQILTESQTESQKKELEVQMCGRELTRVLVVLCNGKFQQMTKRANGLALDDDSNRTPYDMYEEDAYAPKVFGMRIRRNTEERLRYIYQRGIIEQCCRNSCALDSMMVYCSALVN